MQRYLLLSGLIISAPCVAYAQSTEQEVCQRLASALHREVSLLSGIADEATARAALPDLEQTLSELRALHEQVDSEQLWRYIENTPGIKQPLLEDAERLLVELQRLEMAQCYGVKQLRALLSPMLTPGA